MSSMKHVQARTRDAVLSLYETRQVPSWAIFVGTQLMHPYATDTMDDGFTALDQYLGFLEDAESAAVYTLRVYSEIGEGGRITTKTEYDGSINFRFLDQVKGNYPNDGSGLAGAFESYKNATSREIQELKKLVLKQQEEKPDNSVMGVIGQIADSGLIEQLPAIIGSLRELFRQPPVSPPQVEYPNVREMDAGRSSKISGIGLPGPVSVQDGYPEKAVVIYNAIRRLDQHVTDLPVLLTKLADLAEYNPKTFAMYRAMFERIKVKKG